MTEKPGKETLSSRISAEVRRAILRGDMAPGARINLDRLRAAHDVSISPLREAVARLVADRLVVFEDQKGYRVARVSAGELDQIVRLRATLEVMALEKAIDRGDLEWESDVMRALHRVNRAGQASDNPDACVAWGEACDDFHRALVGGCGMPLLVEFCGVLRNLSARYRCLFPAPSPEARSTAAALTEIAMAATARHGPRAAAALRQHIQQTGDDLLARLPDHPPPPSTAA